MAVMQFGPLFLKAQTEYTFRYYTTKDGLIPNGVTDLVQDSLGFIWLNARTHLLRFDGYTFKSYAHNPQDSLSFPKDRAAVLMIDRAGNLWINNAGGKRAEGAILQYDYNTDGFIRHKSPLNGPWADFVSFDKNKSLIWFAGLNGRGLYAYDPTSRKSQKYFNPHPDSVKQHLQNSIVGIQDRDTVLVLGTYQGLWLFDKGTASFKRPPVPPEDSAFLFNKPFIIANYDESNRWLRSFGKMYRLDNRFKPVEVVSLLEQRFQIRPNAFDEDRDGNIWLASRDGLQQFDRATRKFTSIKNPLNSGDSWMWNVRVDRDNNVWALPAGGGLAILQRKFIRTYTSFESTLVSADVLPTTNGDVLVVLGDNGAMYRANLDDSTLNFESVNYSLRDRVTSNFNGSWVGREYFWIAIWGQGILGIRRDATGDLMPGTSVLIQNDPKNPNTISDNRGRDVYEDVEGYLWFASENGLNKIDLRTKYGAEGSITRYTHDPLDSNSLSDPAVRAIIPEDKQSFWLLTSDGLDLYQRGVFHRQLESKGELAGLLYRTSDSTYYMGLPSGYMVGKRVGNRLKLSKKTFGNFEPVGEFSEDPLGRTWMVSASGITILDSRLDLITRLDEADGIIENAEFILRSPGGLMVIGGSKGISAVDPRSIGVSKRSVSPALTRILVNNKVPSIGDRFRASDSEYSLTTEISTLDQLSLDHLHNNFVLEFSAMEMTAPEKNRYRHKLEGYDPEWIETDYKNRTATYTNLPPGTYTFRVKASNHHGVWSDKERTLSVVILPPPWRTWWAYAGYLMLCAGLLVLARRGVVQRERLKANLKLEHVELEKAKEIDRVKTSFFTNISHEFRTPLTLIQGPVQDLLEKAGADRATRDKLKLIQRNSDQLLRLINQLLDLAKIESGNLKIENTSGDLFAFIRAVSSGFSSHAEQKNVTFSIEAPSAATYALFDHNKLETIIINLVNNAIKFTPTGGRVIVRAWMENENGVRLDVRDTGIGIPAGQLSKIFERFHQVSESHKEVGTGIGLALVKELVTLMKGTISVVSAPGEGSTFSVTLPVEMLQVASEQVPSYRSEVAGEHPPATWDLQPATINQHNENGASSKPTVLVVEDNADLRSFIIESLGEEFNFLEAGDGKQGLGLAEEEVPDLIISDVMMPEMDGITMAGKIRKDIRTSHIPLILLTAKSTEDSRISGLKSGADDYLTKPFNKSELLLKVRNGISRQQKLREKLRAEMITTTPRMAVQSADDKFLSRVKECIIARLSDELLSVESLADEIGMSRVQLYRKLTALTGMSVNELIRKLRLQKAAQLLAQKWGPVSQVAYEVGFSNLSYFSKVFKEEFGVLPSEYVDK